MKEKDILYRKWFIRLKMGFLEDVFYKEERVIVLYMFCKGTSYRRKDATR